MRVHHIVNKEVKGAKQAPFFVPVILHHALLDLLNARQIKHTYSLESQPLYTG
jgi:hypothetical protein